MSREKQRRVAERKRIKKALQESEDRYRNLVPAQQKVANKKGRTGDQQ